MAAEGSRIDFMFLTHPTWFLDSLLQTNIKTSKSCKFLEQLFGRVIDTNDIWPSETTKKQHFITTSRFLFWLLHNAQ